MRPATATLAHLPRWRRRMQRALESGWVRITDQLAMSSTRLDGRPAAADAALAGMIAAADERACGFKRA